MLAEYPDLADDWMRLQAQSDGTPFTHWHWISTWLEQLPADIVPRVFRIEDAEGLLALAVAVDAPERGKGRFFGRHSLRLQETGMDALDEISVEYSGLLVRRGGEVAAYAALFRALEGHWEGWRRFRISRPRCPPACTAIACSASPVVGSTWTGCGTAARAMSIR